MSHRFKTLLLLAAFTIACGESAGGIDSFEISPAGTTVSAQGIEIVVPPGAVNSPTTIEVETVGAGSLGADVPSGLDLQGNAVVLTPHGLAFAVPVLITLPSENGIRVVRLDDESDTTWAAVADADEAADSTTFQTSSFSVYAVATRDPTAPEARGLINPPEAFEGDVASAGAELDRETGRVYWPAFAGDGLYQLRRVQLAETLQPETVYETATGSLTIVAVGPNAVYFVEEGSDLVARLSHDLSELDTTWATFSTDLLLVGPGAVSVEHVYFRALPQLVRVALAGGTAEPSPFDRPMTPACAMSPDRTTAACTTGVLDLENDTEVNIKNALGQDISNGFHAADTQAFYFTPQTDSESLYRVSFGSETPDDLGNVARVTASAASGDRLYLGGVQSGIRTIDTATGALLKSTPTTFPADTALIVFGDYLYYGGAGVAFERIPLVDLEP